MDPLASFGNSLTRNDFLQVTKGKKSLSFFTIPQYELWKEETDNGRGWDIKYYKVSCHSFSLRRHAYFIFSLNRS